MTQTVTITDAQASLSRLVERCRAGESFTLVKGAKRRPVAHLCPTEEIQTPYDMRLAHGLHLVGTLARLSGVSVDAIRAYERGEWSNREVTRTNFRKIAGAIGVSASEYAEAVKRVANRRERGNV